MKKQLSKLFGGAIAINQSLIPELKPTGGNIDPKTLVASLIDYVLWFLGALAVIFVIYGGILYITSGGDADKTKKARDTLLYAIIGVVVIVLAIAIVRFAQSFGGQIQNF